jgi:hypothetical protein
LAIKNWLLRHDSAQSYTFFFTREFLTKSNVTVLPPPHTPYFSVYPIEDKGRKAAILTQLRWWR